MLENNKMIITEDDGNQKEMEILFTFEDDEENNFVLVTDPEDEEGEVYPFLYNDDGELSPVEDPKQWEMVQEVFLAFMDGNDE